MEPRRLKIGDDWGGGARAGASEEKKRGLTATIMASVLNHQGPRTHADIYLGLWVTHVFEGIKSVQ